MTESRIISTRLLSDDFGLREKIASYLDRTHYDVIDERNGAYTRGCDLTIVCDGQCINENIEFIRGQLKDSISRLVVLTFCRDVLTLPQEIRMHAAAVVDRAIDREKLLITLNAVMIGFNVRDPTFGAIWFNPATAPIVRDGSESLRWKISSVTMPDCTLSIRERDILLSITEGISNKEIAHRYNISEATVKVHVKHILKKLNMQNRTQAAIWAKGRCLPHLSG
jgi:two-component system, NarL family, nitrate/nitrite response regulator NarL